LAHTQSFSLLDSISAVELFHPSMDSGMIKVDESIPPAVIPSKETPPLTVEQMIGFLDELLVQMVKVYSFL
jgi:hypothetical protein